MACSRLTLLALLALLATAVFGQGVTGSITGLVTDPSAAVVVAAKVSAKNTATGVTSVTETNSAGLFNVPSLTAGPYEVKVESPGFKGHVEANLVLDAARALRVDVSLQVGSVGESVTVQADAPLLQPESSTVSNQVNKTMLNALPFQLTGALRDPTSFVRLTPGATGGAFGANITGGRAFASEVLVDGAPVAYNAATNSPDQAHPSYDTIAEFKVEAVVPPAEYGRTSSGVVTMITQSGGNDVHGNMTLLLRNNVLDSRRYNARIPDVTRQAEYAGSIGGPLIIPKLYNGKNRTFYFGNYTGFQRINVPQGVTTTVATEAMRQGDFSDPRINPIFDPQTAAGSGSRTQFPGNRIPASRFGSFAKSIQNVIPASNVAGQLSGNFIGVGPATQPSDSFLVKIDHQISDKNKFSGNVRYQNPRRTHSRGPLPRVSDGFVDNPQSRNVVLSDDYFIRPNVSNRIQAGYTRFGNPTASSADIGLKVPGAFSGGFPAVTFDGQGFGAIANTDFRYEGDDNYNLQDSVIWTRGKHNIKFGARLDWFHFNFRPLGNEMGTYNFSQFATSQPNVGNTGHSYASFLLGGVNSASLSKGIPYGLRSRYFGTYIQDDWKITKRLTLNYGVRWELQNPWYEVVGRTSQLDITVPNPGAGNRLGAVVFGDKNKRGFQTTYLGGFGPRFGLAYQLTPKTIIRSGYGMFYAPIIGNNLSFQGYAAAIGISTQDGGITPVFNIDQGWPAGIVNPPPFLNPTVANNQNTSTSLTCAGCSGRLPRTSQWQLNVQRTVKDILFEGSYVGTVAHGITNNAQVRLNQVNPQNLSLGNLLRSNINAAEVRVAGYTPPYAGFNGTLSQALRAYPQYQDIATFNAPAGNSTYHAFLFKAEKRFANGLQFLVAYSASKTITDVAFDANGTLAAPQDQFNRRAEKSIANTDRPQRLVLSYFYELPFGAGKAWLKSGPMSKVFGGWGVASIHEYQAAAPLRITVPNGLPIFNGHLRPNRVADVPIRTGPGRGDFQPLNGLTGQAGDVLLNRAAFSTPTAFTFGNLGVYLPNVRAFGTRNEDISVMKKVRFLEKRAVEFRGDFFNAFNRRNLSGPITDLTNPNFGRITGQGNPRTIQLGFRLDF